MTKRPTRQSPTYDGTFRDNRRPANTEVAVRALLDDFPVFFEAELDRLEAAHGLEAEPPKRNPDSMNYSTAVFLINDTVRAVVAIVDPDEDNRPAKRYTFKTFNREVGVGDYVLIQTAVALKMAVAKVVEVDVDVDFEDPTPVFWVFGKLDRTEIDSLLEQEKAAIAAVKKAEAEDKREKLKSSLSKSLAKKLSALKLSGPIGKPAGE